MVDTDTVTFATVMARKTGRKALDLSKHVMQPGAKPAPIVSKTSGRVFPPPPLGGALAAGVNHGHFVDGTQAGRKHLARLTDEQRAALRAARPQNRTELLGLAQSADEQELWGRIAADPPQTDPG